MKSYFSTVASCVATPADQCMDPLDEFFMKVRQEEEQLVLQQSSSLTSLPETMTYVSPSSSSPGSSNEVIILRTFALSSQKCEMALALFRLIEEVGEKGIDLDSIKVSREGELRKEGERSLGY